MNNYLQTKKTFLAQGYIIVAVAAIFAPIFLSFNVIPAFSKEEQGATNKIESYAPNLQTTVTPTVTIESDAIDLNVQATGTPTVTSEFASPVITQTVQPDAAIITPTLQTDLPAINVSFEEINFVDERLRSPFGVTSYRLRIPDNWLIRGDNNFIVLDLSYDYRAVDSSIPAPGVFGDLIILLNDQRIGTYSIESEFEHQAIQIPLPASSFLDPLQKVYVIDLLFNANFICELPHDAELVVHAASSKLFMNYEQTELEPNLSIYPRPFFQRSTFLDDRVQMVFPSSLSNDEATSAVRVAAKFGHLTDLRLPISYTTDIELVDILSEADSSYDEHLIVIGSPENNQLLPYLNETLDLPVPFYERQMQLATQGPTLVVPGDRFSYIFTATNTTSEEADLSVVNTIPQFTKLVDCNPNCQATPEGVVTWDEESVGVDESATFSLTLDATSLISDSTVIVDNTAVLMIDKTEPVNINTLSMTIAPDSSEANLSQIIEGTGSTYFFISNGQAVAEEDGIIQEIVSPWNNDRAIIILTGSTEDAVEKASTAMSSDLQIPRMNGPVALVKGANTPNFNEFITPPSTSVTFEDLGYANKVLEGGFIKSAEYRLQLPQGWQPSNEAFLDLKFSHSKLIDFSQSSMTVSVNRQPIETIPLTEETADGSVRIDLSQAPLRGGINNRFDVETSIEPLGIGCESSVNSIWFNVDNSSDIVLNRGRIGEVTLGLGIYPHPFNEQSPLHNLLFSMPEAPTAQQWERTLNIAAFLGASAEGETLAPIATLGDTLPDEAELGNYNIIAIGQPTANPFLQKINDILPQPFIPGSNAIQQTISDIIFRIPPNVDLGVIQLIESPWNEDHAILTLAGTTEIGVDLSANALLNNRRSLEYRLALLQEDRVQSIDVDGLFNRGIASAIATALPESIVTDTLTSTVEATPTPIVETSPASTTQSSAVNNRPAWLLPMIVGNIIAIFAIFGFAFWQSRRKQ